MKNIMWILFNNVAPKQVSIKLDSCGMEIEVSSHFEDVSELTHLIEELKSIVKH